MNRRNQDKPRSPIRRPSLMSVFAWGVSSVLAAGVAIAAILVMTSIQSSPPFGRISMFGSSVLICPSHSSVDADSIPPTTVENAQKYDIVMYMASGEIPDQEPPEGVQFVTYPEGWSAAHQRGVSLSYSAGTSVNSHRLGFLAPHRYELVHYVEFSGPSGPLPDDVNAVLVERLQNAFAATDLWNEQVNGNEMLEMVLAGGKIDRHIHWRGIFVNVVTPLFVFIAILFIRKLHRSFSRWREGRGRGGPLCPTCLFELRGSFQLTCCPECGQRLNWSRWSLNRKSNTGETIE